MNRQRRALMIAVLLGVLPHCTPQRLATLETTFVFRGSISRAQSSTLAQLTASEQTYAVVVDEVIYQEGMFDDQTGSAITVLDSDGSLEAGRSYLFYTQPVMFGESIAVQLVRVTEDDREGDEIAAEVRQSIESRRLRERVREADLIVVGVVTLVDSAGRAPRIESEHVPDLRQASLRVSEVLKGDLSDDAVDFLFAASIDIQWFRSPKFQVGDEGIFLLNTETRGLELLSVGGGIHNLLHPLDFQPLDQLETIRELL